MDKNQFINELVPHVAAIEAILNKMPDKGLKCVDSQKKCLKDLLYKFSMNVIGTTPEDFIENKEE